MDEFKVNKSKAIRSALIKTAYDKTEKIVEVLSKRFPHLTPLLVLLEANFGFLISYREEKLSQFLEYLYEHQEDVFNSGLISNPEFQDGLIIFVEEYFKLRDEEKLKYAQKIFLDFAKSADMPDYPLERYNDTLQKISDSSLRFLGFIDLEIPKMKKEYALAKANNDGDRLNEDTLNNLIKTYANKPLNFFVDLYVDEKAREEMKAYTGAEPLTEENKIKEKLRKPYDMVKAELEQLGLAKINFQYASIGGGGQEYFNLSDYGKNFVSVIKPDK